MPDVRQIVTSSLEQLDAQTFASLGCADHGLVVLKGAESWGAHESGYILLPTAGGTQELPLAYDEREAPYALAPDGSEDRSLMLSLTDEDDYLACLWARIEDGSPLLGVGVDLSSKGHFAERPPRRSGKPARDLSLLLFTEGERSLIGTLAPADPLLAKATLFAAKEAAFKATAPALRRWYENHDEQLRYEVRHFVMETPGLERGTGRNGAAQRAMDRMGIDKVLIRHDEVCGMAVVAAIALAR